jgi:predicted CXXCH cytochrome family protein
MHNSQGGVPLSEPQAVLLVDDCLGCHSASDGSTWKDDVTGAPIVYNTSAPQYGYFDGTYYQGLAGGNFYWVGTGTDDSKGHNVFPGEGDDLSTAPGGISCGSNSCHENFHLPYNVTYDIGLYGRQGCTGCHMLDDVNQPKGFHHVDGGDSGSVIDNFPWYRFLKGHMRENNIGVWGIEDVDWEATNGPGDHNEYLGEYEEGGNTSESWSLLDHHTMTSFCCGCHGRFHQQEQDGSWFRHPSDAIIPNSGEYADYTTYNPQVPVARSMSKLTGGISPAVTPGEDLVMCLSCHRAHGSPYPDMLRWNYDDMEVGSGGTGGCFKCHTQKN